MRKTKAMLRLEEMIEEALDEHIEEIVEHCFKHGLSYSIDVEVWKWHNHPAKQTAKK